MYRQGLTTTKIAATAGVAKSTVRYHLAIAAQADPSIRDEHRNGTRHTTAPSRAGLRNINDTIALYKAEGRLPSSNSPSARERALATWLVRRRRTTTRAPSPPSTATACRKFPAGNNATRSQRRSPLEPTPARNSPPTWPPGTTGPATKGQTPKKNASWACGCTSNA